MALQSETWLRLMSGKHFGFSDYKLTTPTAAGIFLSHHLEMQ
jgi:hypothetical protein